MFKLTARQRLATRQTLNLIIVVFIIACSVTAFGLAQSTQDNSTPHQRPRRVGTTTTTTPPETPAPATTRATPQTSNAPEEVDEGDVVRVDTQLVSVPAVVTDRTGKPLTGLRADNFTIYEDGQPQKLSNFATTEAPFEVALLLDTSGSTRAEVGLIRRAAQAFVDALRPGDRVAVVAFKTAQDGTTKLAAVEVKTKLTDDRDSLREAIEGIGSSNGTPFYDGLERVTKEIFDAPARGDVRGRRALVALTDGVDSTSESDYDEVRARLKSAGLLTYFIQINTEDFVEDRLMQDCQDDGALRLSRTQLQRYQRIYAASADSSDYANFCRLGQFERMSISRTLYSLARQEMNNLAKDSGGKTFPISDLRDARRAFQQVADEIGTQYSLGYYPTNKARDGGFRIIRVQVRGVRDAQVRAREGYQAPRS